MTQQTHWPGGYRLADLVPLDQAVSGPTIEQRGFGGPTLTTDEWADLPNLTGRISAIEAPHPHRERHRNLARITIALDLTEGGGVHLSTYFRPEDVPELMARLDGLPWLLPGDKGATDTEPTTEAIRFLLMRHGWTYGQLAVRIDPPVNRSTVFRWIAGSPPRPNHAAQLRTLIADAHAAGVGLPKTTAPGHD